MISDHQQGISEHIGSSYIAVIQRIIEALERTKPLPSLSENHIFMTTAFWVMVGIGGLGGIVILIWAIAKALLE